MNNLVTFPAGHAVFLTSKCIFDTCLVNCSASGARLKQVVVVLKPHSNQSNAVRASAARACACE